MKFLFIDGDLLSFRVAAAAEDRSIIAKHKKSGRTKEFKHRTALKEFLLAKGFTYNPTDYEIEDIQKPDDIQNALYSVKHSLKTIKEAVCADTVEIYIGSGDNFRHKLPLPSPYKNGRSSQAKPVLISEIREYLVQHHKATHVVDIETDDVLSIRAYTENSIGNTSVIASIDKDTYQAQGIYVYNWTKPERGVELIPDVGELRSENGKISGNGLKWLAYQCLAGDKVDTYKPYELSNVSYGPTKAYNALSKAVSEQEVIEVLLAEYKRLYPVLTRYTDVHGEQHEKDYLGILDMYWKCAYMMRSWVDPNQDFVYFANSKGVMI
jgi:hypothetical protein